jgi:hypothetical protein
MCTFVEEIMIIYDTPTVSVNHDTERSLIFIKWSGFTIKDTFRKAVDITLDYMLKENLSIMLCDIIEQRIVSPAEQTYAKDKVLEFYRKTGSFKCAFLAKDKTVSMACAARYSRLIYSDLDHELIKLFFSEQRALEWLFMK